MTGTQTRATRQRAAVREVLAETDEFRSAQQLHDLLRQRGNPIGLTTVYRAVQLLADSGELDVITISGDEKLYRQCAKQTHHHHLVCRECGRTREVDMPAVEQAAARLANRYGFEDARHTLEIFGRCPDCVAADPTADDESDATG
ncbi:MAG: Fur family transcriptional regulator [Actinocatenispora sp.]